MQDAQAASFLLLLLLLLLPLLDGWPERHFGSVCDDPAPARIASSAAASLQSALGPPYSVLRTVVSNQQGDLKDERGRKESKISLLPAAFNRPSWTIGYGSSQGGCTSVAFGPSHAETDLF
ncbi:hypothetical protein F5884DRAFT_749856 [Xylogone sp. PMI_703]|nr:hypothetical protein F5884DRAFT_749856 [Xylogone sp. PMI_703]